ncbi:MAG: PQQ-binding-like beta-propeller repeat protein [Pirellulaceae bacterium]
MNSTEISTESATGRRVKWIPWLLILLTLLWPVLYVLSFQFRRELSDNLFQFDFALARIIFAIGVGVFGACWIGWLWFSGLPKSWSRIAPMLLVLAAGGFLVTFRPVFTGGMGIDRWEPRFWDWRHTTNAGSGKATELTAASVNDFSQFLGPKRDGLISGFAPELKSLNQLEEIWRTEVGQAWSGVAARGKYIFTMEQQGSNEAVTCYDIESGDIIWTYYHHRRHDDALGGIGPRTTPTLHEGHIYALGGNGMFVCLNINNGQLIWKQDLLDLLNIEYTEGRTTQGYDYQQEVSRVAWGRAGSPLVVDEMVIVPGGGPPEEDQATLVAFNRNTGAEVWRAIDDGIGYSSPTLHEIAGKRQIVCVNAGTVTGHDIDSGDVLWSFDWPGNSDSDANTSQANLFNDNQFLVSKGYGAGAEAFAVTRNRAGEWSADSQWKSQRVLKTKLTSPVIYDGYAYGLSDGILECVDLQTGKRVWKRGRFGHGQMLIVGEMIVVHSETGSLHLIRATPDGYEEIDDMETVSGVCWNTFCVHDRYIIVRSDVEMACYLVNND